MQILLCRSAIVTFAVTLGLAFYKVMEMDRFDLGLVIPAISIVLVVLAHIAISKDEKLVRSADRLR